MMISGDVERARQLFISSRICAWMVTSSAVVGSSAMISLGLQASADGDHHPLAHAAGKLMRILLQAALGVGDADQFQQLERGRAPSRVHALVLLERSVIWRPMVSTGLSEVIGSWNTMPMSRPRISRISASEAAQVAAVEAHRSLGDAGGAGRRDA